jgi:hypothetical protein
VRIETSRIKRQETILVWNDRGDHKHKVRKAQNSMSGGAMAPFASFRPRRRGFMTRGNQGKE